jgi:hypothetical protein
MSRKKGRKKGTEGASSQVCGQRPLGPEKGRRKGGEEEGRDN